MIRRLLPWRKGDVTILTEAVDTAPWINVTLNWFGFRSAEAPATWPANSVKSDRVDNDQRCAGGCSTSRPGDRSCGDADRSARAAVAPRGGMVRASVFEHAAHGIELELTQFVALATRSRSRLKIRNRSGRGRRLSVTVYVEWVPILASVAALCVDRSRPHDQ